MTSNLFDNFLKKMVEDNEMVGRSINSGQILIESRKSKNYQKLAKSIKSKNHLKLSKKTVLNKSKILNCVDLFAAKYLVS